MPQRRRTLWFTLIIGWLILIIRPTYTQAQTLQTQTYTPSTANFANPERGFFIQRAPLWLNNEREPLDAEDLATYREQGMSVVRAYFLISEYREKPLDADFFNAFTEDTATARAQGFKLIVRFAYNFPTDENYEQSQDASLDWVLRHIEQLKPYLQANADVIAHMEAGFIGAWGEWHSSSNQLIDFPSRGINPPTRTILNALLAALPPTRMIAVRYPLLKQQMFGSAPLTAEQAFNGTDQARVGAHDDCFLASDINWGTYLDAQDEPQIEPFKDYLGTDNQYVVQSGETCNSGEDAQPYIGCDHALSDLARLHWSSLNLDYNEEVLNGWRDQGCFDTIAQRLGYRLVLQAVTAPQEAQVGDTITLQMTIMNDGFANPYNPRGFVLLLRGTDSVAYPLSLNQTPDPRRWQADTLASLNLQATIPLNLATGNYELLLQLPDPEPTLSSDPRYAIRLANDGLWDAQTGYHSLNVWINIVGD